MNDTLKWTLIGVAAYLLYQQYVAAPAAIAAAPAGSAPPAPTPPPAAPSLPAAQAQAQGYLQILNNAGQAAILRAASVPATQLYTPSQWNYYLPSLGVPQPNLSGYGMTDAAVPIGAWWNALIAYYTAAANSPTGLGRLSAAKKPLPLIPVTYDMESTGW